MHAYARHVEWDDADPCAAVECVEFEAGRNKMANLMRFDAPMHEKEMVPFLDHDPRRFWNRPGTIRVEVGDWYSDTGL